MKKIINLFIIGFQITFYCSGQRVCNQLDYASAMSDEYPCQLEHPCGIYFITPIDVDFNITEPYLDAFTMYFDGLSLRYTWEEVEPVDDTYDWGSLQEYCSWVESSHTRKQISLSITTGNVSPDWLKTHQQMNGYTYSQIINIKQDGGSNAQYFNNYPAPYAPFFISEFNEMIDNLYNYLANTPTLNIGSTAKLIDFITMIKITGINTEKVSDETRLPYQDPLFCGLDYMSNLKYATDAPVMWLNSMSLPLTQPFSTTILNAWSDMAMHIHNTFQDKFVDITVLPTTKAFPPISCTNKKITCSGLNCDFPYGCANQNHIYDYKRSHQFPTHPLNPNLTTEIAETGAMLFYPCVAIQSNFLNDEPDNAFAANVFGSNLPAAWEMATIGYQEQEKLANSNTPCAFVAMIDNGIDNHASFIELFPETFDNLAGHSCPPITDVLAYAHTNVQCQYLHRQAQTLKSQKSSLSASYFNSQIHINNESTGIVQCELNLIDVMGRTIMKKFITLVPGDNAVSPSISLNPSIYFVSLLTNNNNSFIYKLSIK